MPIIRDFIQFSRLRNTHSRRRESRRFVYTKIRVKKNRCLESFESRERRESRRFFIALALPADKYVMRYARVCTWTARHATPRGVGVSVCPGVQRGHANIVLKRNRASASREGTRGKAGGGEQKQVRERVTVGDPAAGCRQHSYNTARPARPTHRAQYTVLIPTTTIHTHTNTPHVQYRTARHRRPWEPR